MWCKEFDKLKNNEQQSQHGQVDVAVNKQLVEEDCDLLGER